MIIQPVWRGVRSFSPRARARYNNSCASGLIPPSARISGSTNCRYNTLKRVHGMYTQTHTGKIKTRSRTRVYIHGGVSIPKILASERRVGGLTEECCGRCRGGLFLFVRAIGTGWIFYGVSAGGYRYFWGRVGWIDWVFRVDGFECLIHLVYWGSELCIMNLGVINIYSHLTLYFFLF